MTVLLLNACGKKPYESRVVAFEWVQSNWESVRDHADRLALLCQEHPGATVFSNGILVINTIDDDSLKKFVLELEAANISLVKCRPENVFLDLGGGVENDIHFYIGYSSNGDDLSEWPLCDLSALTSESDELSALDGCAYEIPGGWFATLVWLKDE